MTRALKRYFPRPGELASYLAQPQAFRTFSNEDNATMNRGAVAVLPVASDASAVDSLDDQFFARERGTDSLIGSNEAAHLDAMIESAGVMNVLRAVAALCESRIEDGVIRGGEVILHLSRHSSYARLTERLQHLAASPDLADL